MTDPKDLPPDLTDLRRRAEAQLEAEAIPPKDLTPAQATRLIHDLQVHQIELEMQNEELQLSQARLEESRSKYADLYDFAPVGYLTLDERGRIVEANLTAANQLGVERSKLLGRLFSHFLGKSDRRVWRQLIDNDFNQGERRGVFQLQDCKREVRTMLLDILWHQDAKGRERRRIFLTDISDLKRTQEELIQVNEQLREAKEQLQALFEAAPLAIGVFDTQGNVVNVNPASEHIFGWSLEELKGHLPLSIPTEDPEKSLTTLQRVRQGESFTGLEIKQQRRDGSQIDVSFSAAPLFDAGGNPRGFVGMAEDITERKKLEEEARTQAKILENMAEGVTVTDHHGNIIYTNPAFDAMFGYEKGELVGRHSNILNHYPEEENTKLVEDILKSVNTTGVWFGEFHNCKKDGRPFFTSARISALEVGGKKLYISVQEDITERQRDEEMLRRQAELLDLPHDAIVVWDLQGRITYWNQGAAELYGWTRNEAMGKVVHRLLATEFPQPLEIIETQVLEQGRWKGELVNTTRDGRRLMMDSRWSLKRDEAGRPLAILEINHDVTAHRRAEAALRKSEQRFQRLVEANIIGMAVSDEEKIVEANDAFLQMMGYTREEMWAGKINWLELTPREYLPQDAQALYELRTTGAHTPFEKAYVRKDGSLVPVVVGGALLEEDPLSWVSFVLDITERKQLEDSLRQSEARFRAIFTNASIGMATTDLKGHFQHFNAPVIRGLGYTPAELQGRSFLDFTHPEDLEKDKALFTELAAGKRDRYQLEKRYLRKDGQVLWGRLHVSLVRTPTGEPDFTVALMEDITARKEAQAALEESEARYRSLVELSPDAILVHVRGRVVFVNQAVCQLFGAGSPEEILGQQVLDLAHPDSREIVKQRVNRGYAGERADLRELKIQRLDGQVTEVETAATPITYHGQPAVQVVARDITARKQTEREIRRLASFSELNPSPILEVDKTGQVIYANPATWHMVEKLGLSEGPTAFLPPDLNELFARAREGGPRQYFFDLALKNSVYAVMVSFPHDLPTARLYAMDITERQRAEEALARKQAEFQAIFYSISDGVVFADPGRHVVMVNPAAEAMFGYTSEEMHGRLGEFVYASREDYEEQGRLRYHIQADQPQPPYEITYRRKDGSVFPAESRGSQVRDAQGRVIGFISIHRDITARKRAEEALREREAKLSSILAAAPVGIGLVVDRVIWEVNQRLCQMTGYAPEELLGKSSRLLYPTQGDFEYVGQEKYRQIEELGLGTVETRWQRKDGAVIDVLLSSAPLVLKDASAGSTFTALDITKVKRAEAALRESEDHYRSLFETMAEGVALQEVIYDDQGVARDYRILATNPAYTVHTGLTADQVQGRLASEVYGSTEAPYLETYARVAYIGVPTTFETFFPPLNRYFSISVTSPKPGHFVTVFEDITERKQAEEALRRARDELEERVAERTAALRQSNEQLLREMEERQEAQDQLRDSEARFTAFMEHLPGLAVMRDMEGHYLFANRAWEKTMGLEPGAWQKKTLDELLPPEQTANLQKLDFQIISSGVPLEQVEVQELADGPHYFLTSRFPINDAEGLPYMVGVVAIDITERRRAEQQVEETGRLYRVLSQVNEAIMRGRDQETLFTQVCRIVVEEGLFRMAWVGLTDPVSQTVRAAANYGLEEGYLDNLAIPVGDGPESQGPTGTAVREDRYDICNDYATDPRTAPWREQALARGYRSSGAFPLRIGAKVVGALTLYAHRPEFFPAKEISLLTSLANNLSFALVSLDREGKRRQAEEALRESEGKLRYLAEQMLTAQENERKRLAAELHDELGHALLTLKLALRSIAKKLLPTQENLKQEIQDQLNYINEVIEEVRRLYHDLSPGDLEDLGLTSALENLVENFAGLQGHIICKVDLPDLDQLFSLPVQTVIYRTVQEALTNIGKHANPEHVTVTAVQEGAQVNFAIQDNGRGFDVAQVLGGHGAGRGVGLAAMEERLNMVGGSFAIQSREQEGTRLTFTIPILPEGERP